MADGAMPGMVTMTTAMNVCCVVIQNGGNMTDKSKYMKALRKDPVKLKEFYRAVMGPPHTELTGAEYDQVSVMLALIEPFKSSNNQHCWTDYYKIGDIEYHVTSWPGQALPIIEEYLPE